MRALVCRLLGHRWNYCCKHAYAAGHLWCDRCKAVKGQRGHSWAGETFAGDNGGEWACRRCWAVCDHETPCSRHGDCSGVRRAWVTASDDGEE